jgi:hypothetical protein
MFNGIINLNQLDVFVKINQRQRNKPVELKPSIKIEVLFDEKDSLFMRTLSRELGSFIKKFK